jgi:hypothetical protein
MTAFLAPVGPPNGIAHERSRKLIAALYEHEWYTEEPHDSEATVVSPDYARVMVVKLDGDRLVAYINGERKLLSRAIEYVRGEDA